MISKIFKYLFDFLGFRLIYSMLNRPIDKESGKKKPITFFIWSVGIYIALFGIASQRYENRIDIIETRASAIFS